VDVVLVWQVVHGKVSHVFGGGGLDIGFGGGLILVVPMGNSFMLCAL
jgi:hypothetical protein